MAGIYIHIPFCKQACHYCDFHFSTSLNNKEALLKALQKEIVLQKDYLGGEVINTIYFGGGTPSLLSQSELMRIVDDLHQYHTISSDAEITLEANPDDLTNTKLKDLKNTPINRLSIGIQSFYEEDLKLMNRAHTSKEALRVVKDAQDNEFSNITIDLIYGIPSLSNKNWASNLQTAFDLEVKHISAYCLTVEPKTALAHLVKEGKIKNVDDQHSAEQFEIMLHEMRKNNFEQYEISNFCKDDCYSKHNSNYWLKKTYLGLGPSAHSYNGTSRQWNVSNNAIYIQSLASLSNKRFEEETLTTPQQYNEYILTSLRTKWGTDLNYIETKFGSEYLSYCLQEVDAYINSGNVKKENNTLFLTDKGKLIADKIASDLFILASPDPYEPGKPNQH